LLADIPDEMLPVVSHEWILRCERIMAALSAATEILRFELDTLSLIELFHDSTSKSWEKHAFFSLKRS
jgi:hypothetical protein